MRLQFAGRAEPGVGISLELQIVDLETWLPVPAASSLLTMMGDEPCIREGLFQSIAVIETDIFPTVDLMGQELRRLLNRLRLTCATHGLGVLAAGTHPLAGWRDLHLSQQPRYETFIRRLQWVGRRAAVFGLRIQVGMPDGEKAIAVGNSIASLVPMFVALSASSPFWRGLDTGLASCRTRVIENIPNAGLPPNLLNFGEFQAYVKTLRAAETIESINDIWWDVRPNVRHGTLELQACDMPHTVRECLALTALAQALIVWVRQTYEEGGVMPQIATWIVRENKWRATRFGLDAELVATPDGGLRGIRSLFDELRLQLEPTWRRLGLEAYFADLEQIFQHGPGYLRQRRALQELGLEQVPGAIMDELSRDQAYG